MKEQYNITESSRRSRNRMVVGFTTTCAIIGLWSLTPLSTINQLHRGGSFIDGGKRRTRRKPPTCCKSLTNCIT
jgi:hypothetical protein